MPRRWVSASGGGSALGVVGVLAWSAVLCACGSRMEAPSSASGPRLDCAVPKGRPRTGPLTVRCTLLDSRRPEPIQGATLRLEGNMTHPGMVPEEGTARETRPGHYEGTLDLTMAGDWVVLIEAALPDGRTVRQELELPNVREAGAAETDRASRP